MLTANTELNLLAALDNRTNDSVRFCDAINAMQELLEHDALHERMTIDSMCDSVFRRMRYNRVNREQ